MRRKEKILAVLFTAAAIGFNSWYMDSAVIFLNIGLVISLILWLNHSKPYNRNLSRLYVIGVLIQLTHFLEEYYTGFYEALPSIFNVTAWTGYQFVMFNIIWLIINLLAAIGIYKNIGLSFLMLWFFVLVNSIGNGILHVGLSLMRKEYFPGTVTAVLLFVIGIIMMQNILLSSSMDKSN